MNISKYLIISSLAIMAIGCQDDKELVKPTPTADPGTEIQFGCAIDDDAVSRTAFGKEENNAFPVTWIKYDKVFIHSPHVTSDAFQNTYMVPDDVESHPGYAGHLEKLTESGIQWGTETSAYFYSVYPSRYVGYTDEKPTLRCAKAEKGSHVITVDMNTLQTCKYNRKTSDATTGSTFNLDSVDRYGALMYAKNTGNNGEGVVPGQTVNLRYKPLATAIRVKLKGPKEDNNNANVNENGVAISQIVLRAPKGVPISGDFDVDFSTENEQTFTLKDGTTVVTPKIQPVKDEVSNVIYMQPQFNETGEPQLVLKNGESVDLNIFLMVATHDEDGNKLAADAYKITDDWTIEVVLTDYHYLTKKLGSSSATANTTLVPGMAHKLRELPEITTDLPWDISKWMTYIPRNVYLSEISIPGSWESLNPTFQGAETGKTKPDLKYQYDNGCRAFHINCCYKRSGSWPNYTYELGTDDGGTKSSTNNQYMTDANNPLFSTSLETIASKVKKDEYMIVMCTLTLKAGIPSGRDKNCWIEDISTACDNINKKYNKEIICDGSKITASTTVGDVHGQVIVIVNCEDETPSINNSRCLFVKAPLGQDVSDYPVDGDYKYGTLNDGTNKSIGITLNYTQGQVSTFSTPYQTALRDFAPLVEGSANGYYNVLIWTNTPNGSRENNCNALLKASNNGFNPLSASYLHNQWYYFGIGGYRKPWAGGDDDVTDWDKLAKKLNDWFNGKVLGMATDKYYPVGIVLMNFAAFDDISSTKAYTPFTVSEKAVNGHTTAVNILKLNNRYKKAYDPTKDPYPADDDDDTSTQNQVPKASRASSGGWD